MSEPPPTSPWPAPTLADAAPLQPPMAPPAANDQSSSELPGGLAVKKPVTTALEAAKRLINPALRAEHSALKEEQRIVAELTSLPNGWFVVPATSVEVLRGLAGSADQFVVGAGGVFIIHLEHQHGGRVWVSERAMTVNGQPSDVLAEARFEARLVGGRLSDACGFAVTVQSVWVMIGATVQTVSRPAEVHVRAQHDLRDWLCLQPRRLDAGEAATIGKLVSSVRPVEHVVVQDLGSSTTTGICRDVLR
jgi:hypothetical protein